MKTALGIVGLALVLGGVSLAGVRESSEEVEATKACCMSDRALAPEYAAATEGSVGDSTLATPVSFASSNEDCSLAAAAACDAAAKSECDGDKSECDGEWLTDSGEGLSGIAASVVSSFSEKSECSLAEKAECSEAASAPSDCSSEKQQSCSKSLDANIDT